MAGRDGGQRSEVRKGQRSEKQRSGVGRERTVVSGQGSVVSGQGSGVRGQEKKQRYAARVVGGTPRDQWSDVRGQQGKQRFQAKMVGGKVSEDLFERGLCLPSGTAMTEGDLDRVIDTILNCRFR